MDQNVKGYIEKQKSPQKEILKKVRRIFLETLPNPQEKMGWGVVTFGGGKFYIAYKNPYARRYRRENACKSDKIGG
jgi:hypothetical protein